MSLRPNGVSDSQIADEHPPCEQWLYMISGTGAAVSLDANGRRRSMRLRRGVLLVIERRERHQIRNTGRQVLRTLNMYVPDIYNSGRSEGLSQGVAKIEME